MKNLSYEIYLANPEIRDELEQDVRRARAEAFSRYIMTPPINVFSKLFRRAAPRRAQIHLKTAQEISHG